EDERYTDGALEDMVGEHMNIVVQSDEMSGAEQRIINKAQPDRINNWVDCNHQNNQNCRQDQQIGRHAAATVQPFQETWRLRFLCSDSSHNQSPSGGGWSAVDCPSQVRVGHHEQA